MIGRITYNVVKTAGGTERRVVRLVEARHTTDSKLLSNQFSLFKTASFLPTLNFIAQETVISFRGVQRAMTFQPAIRAQNMKFLKPQLSD